MISDFYVTSHSEYMNSFVALHLTNLVSIFTISIMLRELLYALFVLFILSTDSIATSSFMLIIIVFWLLDFIIAKLYSKIVT